jgi:hypothetical protein
MSENAREFRIAHLDAHTNPFTRQPVTRTRCAICNAQLPLPGDYPMVVIKRLPHPKLYDMTGQSGSTDENGQPRVLQTGIAIERPVCWTHTT